MLSENGGTYIIRAGSNIIDSPRNVGIDSSGFNLSNTCLWRKEKWGTGPKRRGWLKLHVLSDVDTGEVIAFAVTDKNTGDSPLMIPLLDAAVAALRKLLEDRSVAAYSDFISLLYPEGANFSEYIRKLVLEDDNFYVKAVAAGQKIDPEIAAAVKSELNTICEIAGVTSAEIRQMVLDSDSPESSLALSAAIFAAFSARCSAACSRSRTPVVSLNFLTTSSAALSVTTHSSRFIPILFKTRGSENFRKIVFFSSGV